MCSNSGTNAFRTDSSNSPVVTKPCPCATIAFLAGIFPWPVCEIKPSDTDSGRTCILSVLCFHFFWTVSSHNYNNISLLLARRLCVCVCVCVCVCAAACVPVLMPHCKKLHNSQAKIMRLLCQLYVGCSNKL